MFYSESGTCITSRKTCISLERFERDFHNLNPTPGPESPTLIRFQATASIYFLRAMAALIYRHEGRANVALPAAQAPRRSKVVGGIEGLFDL